MRWPILLVDDNLDDRDLFARASERSGWDLALAWSPSAEDALERLRQGHLPGLRLMVIDLRLPSLSGVEFLQAASDLPGIQAVPKVIFTTSGLESDIRAALDVGAQAFVQKPLDLRSHARAVQTMLDFWLGQHRMPTSQGKP